MVLSCHFKLLSCIVLLVISFVCVESLCSAGTGGSPNNCLTCVAGYYCPAGSVSPYGWTGVIDATPILVGSGTNGYVDGVGTFSNFNYPMGVSVSPDGTFALVADTNNNMIGRVTISSGAVTTLAGNTSAGFFDGTGTFAMFNQPESVAIDPSGVFALVADSSNNCIRRIQISTRYVTTLAGSSSSSGSADGNGTLAKFSNPRGVAISPNGMFALISDIYNRCIRRVEIATGVVSTLASSLNFPTGIAISSDGSFALIAAYIANVIYRIEIPSGTVTTFAGNASTGFVDGTGTWAMFNQPYGVAIDPSGVFALVADSSNHRIRRIELASRSVSTMSGALSGMPYGQLSFSYTYGVSIAPNGAFVLLTQKYDGIVRYISMSSKCSAGYYCPSGSSTATQSPCSAGFYCPAGSSASNQSVCSAGFYCPAGSSAPLPCRAGSFCPPGSSVASPFICNAGYYCPAGSSTANQTICNPGYYCPAGVTNKLVCSAGHFCSAGASRQFDFTSSTNTITLVGSQSIISSPVDVAVYPNDAFALVVQATSNSIRRVEILTGKVSVIAGSEISGNADGIGTLANFNNPTSVSVDPTGTFALVADRSNHRIRRIELSTGAVTTIAGSISGASDGTGTSAMFNYPSSVAIAFSGEFLLVVDSGNNRIRYIEMLSGIVTTLAGNSTAGSTDGTGILATFNNPSSIAIDSGDSIAVVTEQTCYCIRYIDISTGVVTRIAGNSQWGSTDAVGTLASFARPSGISISSDSNGVFALVADYYNNRIRRIAIPSGDVTTFAGSLFGSGTSDGIGTSALFSFPSGIAIASSGSFALVADTGNNRIRRIELITIVVSTLVGNAQTTNQVALSNPSGVSIAPSSSAFALVADQYNNRIIRIEIPSGITTVLAGSYSSFADGAGTLAMFNYPSGVAISSDSVFALVADRWNHRIRRVDISSRTVTTLAGNASAGLFDGTGSLSMFNYPQGVAIDPNGAFALVADSDNHCIRRIQMSTRAVTTLAGGLVSGRDDGNGTLAKFYQPVGVAISPNGIFALVADFYNGRIRRIEISTRVVSTLPISFSLPSGVAISSDGAFALVAEQYGHRICHIDISTGVVRVIAGNSVLGASDGIGTLALFKYPSGVAIAPNGVFAMVVDQNNQVRMISSNCSAGFYCPAGSSSPTQSMCAVGYFCSEGSTSKTGSGQCSAGFYCPAGSSSSKQLFCPLGSFCPPNPGGAPTTCPAGTYCNTTGLSSAYICDAGKFCTSSALSAPTGLCSAGYFCPAGSYFSNANICPPGSYCPVGSAVNILCPVGTYCPGYQLTSVLSAINCSAAQICPPGSTAPSSSCPSGYTCIGNSAIPCTAGKYCPGGSAGALTCPIGSFCPIAQLSTPTPCTGGYYCNTAGLTVVSLQCPIGQVCPEGSALPANCPAGYMCATAALAIPTPCPAGSKCTFMNSSVCPIGTYTLGKSTSCLNCPSGLFSANSGSSSCFLCAFGSFSSNGVSCSSCPSGTSCLLGSSMPIPSNDLQRIARSNPATSNPFQSELVSIAAAQVQQTGLVLGFGSACVVILLSVAIASQKYDSVGRLLNCRSGSTLTWVDLDFFFSEVHWTPADSTLPAQHRHTTFGGMVSVILIVTIVFVSIQLGTSNLSPTYSSSVSIEPPQWQPHGFYSLTVTIFGSGLQSCVGSGNSEISIQWVQSHWSGSPPTTQLSYNPADGSCLVSWTCNPCQLVTVNTSPLRIIVSSNSFSTHAQYSLKTPPFTISSTDLGSESQGPFSVSGYIASGDFSTPTAFQGDATVVTMLLTVFNVTLGYQQRIAFQPVVTNTERGKIITPQTFNLSSQIGFEYRFDLTANSFTLVNIGQTGNVFNLIVLLLSLAGSIISGFSLLLPELEKRLRIVTIWGAPAMEGDVGRSWSDKISEIDVRLMSMAFKAKQFEDMVETRFIQMSESIQKNFPTISFDFISSADNLNAQNTEAASGTNAGRRRSVVLPSLSAALVGYYDGVAASSAVLEKNLKTPAVELTEMSESVRMMNNRLFANAFADASISTPSHSAKPPVSIRATNQSNTQLRKTPPPPRAASTASESVDTSISKSGSNDSKTVDLNVKLSTQVVGSSDDSKRAPLPPPPMPPPPLFSDTSEHAVSVTDHPINHDGVSTAEAVNVSISTTAPVSTGSDDATTIAIPSPPHSSRSLQAPPVPMQPPPPPISRRISMRPQMDVEN